MNWSAIPSQALGKERPAKYSLWTERPIHSKGAQREPKNRSNLLHSLMQDFSFTSAHLPLTPVRDNECKQSSARSQNSGQSTSAELCPGQKELYSSGRRGDRIRRRQRKTREQLEVLVSAFDRGRIWTVEDVKFLSLKTGLTPTQVCKWRWDYDHKLRKTDMEAKQLLLCTESLSPLPLASAIKRLQQQYDEETLDISESPTRVLALPRSINNCFVLPH